MKSGSASSLFTIVGGGLGTGPGPTLSEINVHNAATLTRTDWIEFDHQDQARFTIKLEQAIREINALAEFERDKLEVALEAERMDCAIAFERVKKAFLLTGEQEYIERAEIVLDRLEKGANIDDLHRERNEIRTFIRQANRSLSQ